jgi:hypothetical protein
MKFSYERKKQKQGKEGLSWVCLSCFSKDFGWEVLCCIFRLESYLLENSFAGFFFFQRRFPRINVLSLVYGVFSFICSADVFLLLVNCMFNLWLIYDEKCN